MAAFMSSLISKVVALRAMGLRVVMNLPRMRVSGSLTPSIKRTKVYRVDGEWESSAQSGLANPGMITKVVRQ